MSEPIRVLLVDDQALVRGAIGALLALEGDIQEAASVGSGEEALAWVQEHPHGADVALMDIQLPGMTGLAAVREMRALPGPPRALMLTTFARPGYLREALDARAHSFVVKDAPAEALADAVRRVHAGLRVIDPSLAEASLIDGMNPLTEREREVLRVALSGAAAPVIAAQLHLSAGTVRNHLSSAIGKTGASNRAEAARLAQEKGWI